jgi:two-component system cell cycle sensor histidine kinase/response regulator CckA
MSVTPFHRLRMRNKLLLAYLAFTIPLILILAALAQELIQGAIRDRIESELRNSTRSILNLVHTSASASVKNYLRAVAEKNRDIVEAIYERQVRGELTREAALARMREILARQVIGETGYIYCLDSRGTAVFHPNPQVEGRDHAHFAFVQEQMRQKTGYLEYDWRNPGEPSARPKALYMVYFAPLDWIISASTYRQEFDRLIQVEDFREAVLAFRFGPSGYSFILDREGRALVHPLLTGGHPPGQVPEGRFILDIPARESGQIRYRAQNPGEERTREKLVFFDRLPEYGWTVASSSYTEEVFAPLAQVRRLILAVAAGLILLTVVVSLAVSAHFTAPVGRMIDTIQRGAEGGLAVRLDTGGTFEFGRLAAFFNRFMERLEESHGRLRDEIAERRQAEEDLRASEEKYRLLAENVRDVIWTLDMDLRYTYVSPSAERLQGWRPEEFLELGLEQVLPPHSLALAQAAIAAELDLAARTGDFRRGRQLELELYRREGGCIWTEITATFLVDADGRPSGILGVTRDISERRAAEQEKLELQEQLARARKMEALGLLAGGVAHDLNNVLAGIVSYPDLLLMDLPADSPLADPLRTVKQSGNKAARIVQDLLTLARRGVVTLEPLQLNEVVSEYLHAPEHRKLRSFHPEVAFEVALAADLPPLRGSAVHLRNTLMNLASNAAEAQPGGGRVVIATERRVLAQPHQGYQTIAPGEYVVLRVADAGHGIAEADWSRIFEPFYTKKVLGRSGTGLGMAVVWGTMQDHGGGIDIQSRLGEGTIFELYLPATREPVAHQGPAVDLVGLLGRSQPILVVDDVQEQREVAARMLTRLNYLAFTVASGEKAVAFLQDHPVDLVVLDMIMEPGMDGLDTWRALRAQQPGLRAVIVTGFAETERVLEAQRLGAGPCLHKPYTIEELGQAVREALRAAPGPERSGERVLPVPWEQPPHPQRGQ